MRIIQKADSTFESVVRFQRMTDGVKCRPSSFVVRADVPEGVLLYHTLSCEMVLVEGSGCDGDVRLSYLPEHWYEVPEDLDEKKLLRQYRRMLSLLDTKPVRVMSYTILTTTDCNARCFYCYELGRSRIPMTGETAGRVVDLIIKNYNDLPKEEKFDITLHWFGGEPLYNAEVINFICSRLKSEGVPFKSKMHSNGYLFDAEMVCRASSLWNLRFVQITMDGTEETYNRTKAFIHTEGSPYRRVLGNIGLLLDAGIRVIVRMNIGTHNSEDLFSLSRELAGMFGGKKGFSCYSHPLFENVGSVNSVKQARESRQEVYDRQKELTSLLDRLGIFRAEKLRTRIPMNRCKVDSGRSLLIVPDGNIGLCDYYSESDFISHIDSPDKVDSAMVQSFREAPEDLELCGECPIYPQCIRLNRCMEESDCHPELVQHRLDRMRLSMISRFKQYKASSRDVSSREDVKEDDDMNQC